MASAELNHEEHSEGERTLVLLHGFGSSIDNWRDVIPLIDGYRIVAFDLPGHGGSTAVAAGGRIPRLAEIVHDAITALGIDRFTLAGYSLGGGTAVQIALNHPDQIEALVGVVPFNAAGTEPDDPVLAAFSASYGNEEALRAGVAGIAVGDPAKGDRLVTDMLKVTEEAWQGFLTGGAFESRADQLPGLTVPTCYIVAAKDAAVRVERQVDDIRALPNGRLVLLSDAGHLCAFEIPERIAAEINFFLAGR